MNQNNQYDDLKLLVDTSTNGPTVDDILRSALEDCQKAMITLFESYKKLFILEDKVVFISGTCRPKAGFQIVEIPDDETRHLRAGLTPLIEDLDLWENKLDEYADAIEYINNDLKRIKHKLDIL